MYIKNPSTAQSSANSISTSQLCLFLVLKMTTIAYERKEYVNALNYQNDKAARLAKEIEETTSYNEKKLKEAQLKATNERIKLLLERIEEIDFILSGGKTVLITRNNGLDGICCAVLGIYEGMFDVIYVASSLDESIINEGERIYVTDINLPEEQVNRLINSGVDLRVLTHQSSSSFLKNYKNCIYDPTTCSTGIIYDKFITNKSSCIESFIYRVNHYDNWIEDADWNEGQNLNRLFNSYKTEVPANTKIYENGEIVNDAYKEFIELMIEKFADEVFEYTIDDVSRINEIVDLENAEIDRVNSTLERYADERDKLFGIFISKAYTSIVGNRILELNPDLDYVIITYEQRELIELRSLGFNLLQLDNAVGIPRSASISSMPGFVKTVGIPYK